MIGEKKDRHKQTTLTNILYRVIKHNIKGLANIYRKAKLVYYSFTTIKLS